MRSNGVPEDSTLYLLLCVMQCGLMTGRPISVFFYDLSTGATGTAAEAAAGAGSRSGHGQAQQQLQQQRVVAAMTAAAILGRLEEAEVSLRYCIVHCV
jgi:hypothetical protein